MRDEDPRLPETKPVSFKDLLFRRKGKSVVVDHAELNEVLRKGNIAVVEIGSERILIDGRRALKSKGESVRIESSELPEALRAAGVAFVEIRSEKIPVEGRRALKYKGESVTMKSSEFFPVESSSSGIDFNVWGKAAVTMQPRKMSPKTRERFQKILEDLQDER